MRPTITFSLVSRSAGKRSIVLIAENETQKAQLVRSADQGGYGLDAMWNDDFHHAAHVAVTGHNEAYYSDYLGSPQELISSVKWGFLYQGQYYTWQKKRRGSYALDLKPSLFVNYLQNHDQVANSACGQTTSPGRFRAITALLLLAPGVPMLFQGQEFGASSPFLYFADHNKELAALVAEGRSEFLEQFPCIASSHTAFLMGLPHEPGTFERCKLDWSELEKNVHTLALHRDLLKLRREDPVFASQRSDWMHGAVLASETFALRFIGGEYGDRLMIINLGRGLRLGPAPEPLIAPPAHSEWQLLWSSDDTRYGGPGVVRPRKVGPWKISSHSALVLYETPHD
jgi:maltooligosyltrehalose trehalohydrolase